MLMHREKSLLLIVDIQEKLAPAILNADSVVANAAKLIQAAKQLNIPKLASEQYRKGLGATVSALSDLLPADAIIEKTHFSCHSQPGFAQRLARHQRKQIILCGMEAHVCVLQTALDLNLACYETFIVADAVSSRTQQSYDLGLARLRALGSTIVNTEMVLFEWLSEAGTAEFKALLPLIK